MNFDEPGIKWQRVKRRTDSVFDYALSRNDERENKLIGRTFVFWILEQSRINWKSRTWNVNCVKNFIQFFYLIIDVFETCIFDVQ